MAARLLPFGSSIVSLRTLPPGSLDLLLAEQSETWRTTLDWDFLSSAELIRGFANSQSLEGLAIVDRDQVLGYSYFSVEGSKAQIGELYVQQSKAASNLTSQLLGRSVEVLFQQWKCVRVETQLMLLDPDSVSTVEAFGLAPRSFHRGLMVLPKKRFDLADKPLPAWCQIVPFRDSLLEEAARLLTESYSGHADASINDQYRDVGGARNFLTNIVKYPGCGDFSPRASFVVRDMKSNRLAGLLLASMVSPRGGHITQLCVSPRYRGQGIGYALARQCVVALEMEGASRISLSVTSENRVAVALYQKMGFETERPFVALVWERPVSLARRFFPF
jgi:ribosomal protein S18 acetylase RimI-like enzyme